MKKRTLTNLYNERPTWLENAHRDLDAAVATAYGWPADITEQDALTRLLALNRERSAEPTRRVREEKIKPNLTELSDPDHAPTG